VRLASTGDKQGVRFNSVLALELLFIECNDAYRTCYTWEEAK
jgi:hypothetical protein